MVKLLYHIPSGNKIIIKKCRMIRGGLMKIVKNAIYEYEKNNINEESGYTKWYNKAEILINRIIGVILSYGILLIFLHICSDAIKQNFKVPKEAFEVVSFFCGVLIIIFAVPILWKVIQFVITSKGRLDEKCIFSIKNPSASVYNKKTTRKCAVICLIVPGILFILLFSILTILSDGVQKLFFILMVFRTMLCATDDIGTLWCLLRYVGKNDVIFGEYKKTVTEKDGCSI